MELSQYSIGEDGSIFYSPPESRRKDGTISLPERHYRVWGVSKHGFHHGIGAYLSRERLIEKGLNIKIIYEPSFLEIDKYYNDLYKFRDFFRDDKDEDA